MNKVSQHYWYGSPKKANSGETIIYSQSGKLSGKEGKKAQGIILTQKRLARKLGKDVSGTTKK